MKDPGEGFRNNDIWEIPYQYYKLVELSELKVITVKHQLSCCLFRGVAAAVLTVELLEEKAVMFR